MKLYCSGMQKPHRKKRFLFVRRTTPRSGGTLRAAFYSACTLILHASHAKNAGGDGGTGAVGAIFASAGTGSGKPVCAQTKERVNRISFVRRRFDRVFPRAVEPPAFLCRREETASLPRTGEPTTLFTRTVGPTAFLSCAGGQPYRKNAARQDAPAARRFFRRVRPPSPFCRTAFGSAGAAGAAHGSSKFSKNQPLPFYVISKRA